MFEVVKIIPNIRYYKFHSKDLFLISIDNKLKYLNKEIILFKTPITGFEIFNNKVFLNDWEAKYEIYDIELNELEKGSGKGFFQSSNLYLGYRSLSKNGKMIDSLLGQNDEILELGKLEKFNNLNISNEESYIINAVNNQIHAYTLPTALPLWQFDLTTLPPPFQKNQIHPDLKYEVKEFVGVLHDVLWVAMSHHTLLGIDVQSGKLVHTLSHIPAFEGWCGPVIPDPSCMRIDHKRQLLIGMAWEFYWEIDPRSGAIAMYDLTDYFRSLHLRNDLPSHTVFLEEEGKLFFISRHLDKVKHYTESQIACLDVNTRQITWQYKFAPDEQGHIPQLNGLKGSSTKLGALDMNHNLYVFERE